MENGNKRTNRIYFYIAFGVILYLLLQNGELLSAAAERIADILLPIFSGLLLAFIAHVPVSWIDWLLMRAFSKAKHKPKTGTITFISLMISLGLFALLIVLVCTITVPHLASSLASLYALILRKWPEWVETLRQIPLLQNDGLIGQLESTDIRGLLDAISDHFSNLWSVAVGLPSSLVSWAVTGVIAAVISIYVLLDKDMLCTEGRRFVYAYFRRETAEELVRLARLTNQVYTRFLSGQFLEAVLLGLLMFLTLTVFRIPYAGITATLTGICSFIPYVGSAFSFVVGGLLTFLAEPEKIILYCVVYCVTQFVENQFLYPHVVGSSVGLPPLLTLIAVTVGGRLMGLVGMVFSIPLTAVIYTIYQEHTQFRLYRRGYKPPEPESS